MYSSIYITYWYERTGRMDACTVNGYCDTTKIEITLSKDSDAVGFKYVRGQHGHIYDYNYPMTAEMIRKIRDTSRYDYQDIVPELSQPIVQEIRIDVPDLIKSEYLYIPFSSQDVTDEIYFDEDEANEKLDMFDYINTYIINKDPNSYNIDLKYDGIA